MRARAAWITASLLAIAVIAGFAVRLAPCVRHPDFEFIVDGRYHQRLTAEVAEQGRLAPVDPLCNAPAGRRTTSFLPVGLYYVGAAFARALAPFGLDARWSLAVLGRRPDRAARRARGVRARAPHRPPRGPPTTTAL